MMRKTEWDYMNETSGLQCFASDEVGLMFVSDEKPDDRLVDIARAKDTNDVVRTCTPLMAFEWAHSDGYSVEVTDHAELVFRNSNGEIEFYGWLQHKDFFHEMDRSNADARWM
jgi:hypothetical protein